MQDNVNLNSDNCTFTNSAATKAGGVIYSKRASTSTSTAITLTSCKFVNSYARAYGGVAYFNDE